MNKMDDICRDCGLERREHHHDGAAYGVCGQFSEVAHQAPADMAALADDELRLALANDYEAGLNRALASGYEEFGPTWERRQRIIIAALRAAATAEPGVGQAFAQCEQCWQPATCKKYGCSVVSSPAPHPEVKAEPRFFIDHGMIHDRATGKHVTTDGQPPFEDGIEQVLDLLNGLSGIAATPPSDPNLAWQWEKWKRVAAGPQPAVSDAAAGSVDPGPNDRTEIAWLLLSRWENIARNGGEKWLASHPLVQETTDLLNDEATVVSRPMHSPGEK